MPDVTKIIEALRARGDTELADEIAAEFKTEAKAAVPKQLMSDLDNLADFVLSLGLKPGDKKVIQSGFKDLKAEIQKMLA